MSPSMLAVAAQKHVYEQLQIATLGNVLNFEDGSFSAVVAAGVFTAGHASPDSFDELIRVTRPGGHVIFSVNSQVFPDGFEDRQNALVQAGTWQPVYRTGPHPIMAADASAATALFFVYQRGDR